MRKEVRDKLSRLKEEHVLPSDVIEQWKLLDISLSDEELFNVAQWLIQDDVFWWLDLISYLLPKIVSNVAFLDLVSSIANQVRGDLAQGPFIKALITIGEKQPILAKKLYKKIISDYPNFLDYGGLLLGGVARIDNHVREKILNEVIEKSANECESLIRAIRVAFEKAEQMDSRVFHTLQILKEKEDSKIKREIALAYFDFYVHNKQKSFDELSKLSRSNDWVVRYSIANQLSMRELDTEHLLELINILSDDTESSVLNQVTMAIARKCNTQTEFCMSIIKKWAVEGKYREISNINWTLNQIGKADLKQSLLIAKNWFKEKNWRIDFYGPKILWELGSHNVETLTHSFLEWLREEYLINIALEGIRRILAERYKSTEDTDEIVDIIFKSLYDIAESRDLDAERIALSENFKIFKCCALINAIEREIPKIDYESVFSNLEKFPHIKDFIGINWFEKRKEELNIEHPLLNYLSNEVIQDRTKNAFLSHLNRSLSLFDRREPNIGDLRHGLQDNNLFWSTVSEIDVISRLRRMYEVKIAPTIGLEQDGKPLRKHPDLMVNVDSNQILIEVITPQMFAPLKYFRGPIGIPDRVRSKVYTEFQEHFKGQILERDVIIVIDIGRSEVNYDSAEDYLKGSFQITLRIDKETGEVIDTYPSRANDAMITLDPETRVIIGLILYQRVIGSDSNIRMSGRFFANEAVLNMNRRKIISKIKNAFFE